MAKRSRNKKSTPKEPWFDDLSPHAKQAIMAVLVAVVGVFLAASLFDFGGLVGQYVNVTLVWLFGTGAYLAPLICAFYVFTLLNPTESERVSLSKVVGGTLFFISILGLLELYGEHLGGMVGLALLWPLEYLTGSVVAGALMFGLVLISGFLIFNTGLRLPRWGSKESAEEEEVEVLDDDVEYENETNAETANEEPAAEETSATTKPAKSASSWSKKVTDSIGKTTSPEFAVSTFRGTYDPPSLKLLSRDNGKAKTGDVKANANIIKRTLKEFGINVEMDAVEIGPTITRYSLKPAQGVKIARIVGLQQELQLNLSSGSLRIEAPIPGKSLVGIEVPNIGRGSVGLASLLKTPEFTDSPHPLLVVLGKDVTGHGHFANIARMPHALIAGTTGSGKSITIHNLIVSLLFRNSPEQLRFIMVDPKRVEMTLYEGIPHLLSPVITDAKKVLMALKWAIKEMERRYDILQTEGVQNLDSYHTNVYQKAKKAWEDAGSDEEERANLPEPLPYIIIVIDELADLMHAYPRELEASIVRLAQMLSLIHI